MVDANILLDFSENMFLVKSYYERDKPNIHIFYVLYTLF